MAAVGGRNPSFGSDVKRVKKKKKKKKEMYFLPFVSFIFLSLYIHPSVVDVGEGVCPNGKRGQTKKEKKRTRRRRRRREAERKSKRRRGGPRADDIINDLEMHSNGAFVLLLVHSSPPTQHQSEFVPNNPILLSPFSWLWFAPAKACPSPSAEHI